jgi:hypothetical protein
MSDRGLDCCLDVASARAAIRRRRHAQKVEEGTVNVTLRTVEMLAAAFGVDIADMLRR